MRYGWRLRLLLLAVVLGGAACSEVEGPEQVGSVEVVAPQQNLQVGDTVTLQARPRALDRRAVQDRAVTWLSSDTAVVVVTSAGRAQAVAPGRAVVRARVGDKVGEVELAVSLAPAASLEVMPRRLVLVEGDSEMIVAMARNAAGDVLTDRPATWISEDTAIAEVDALGRVTGRARGITTVTARVDGQTAVAEVIVTAAPVALIEVTPAAAVLNVGGTRQMMARVLDTRGRVVTDRPVMWTVDAPAVAAISPSGELSAVGPGYVTVTATSDGRSSSVAATVVNGELDAMPYDLIYHRTLPGVVGEIMMLPTTAFGRPVVLNAGNVSRQPAPSPDGQRIAFYVSMVELGTGARVDDIFAVDRNGMHMARLTHEPGNDDQPAWSPDGSRIVWRHMDAVTGRTSIRLMNADGSGKVNLTADMEATHWVGYPAWSPDGSRIAFSATTTAADDHGIWTMSAEGRDRRQHTSSRQFDSEPTWSPDGQRIAFIRRHGEDPDITIVTLATGAITRLSLPGQQRSPAWSPDGRHFAFWQPIGFSGSTAIYTVRADGTNVRLHTLDPIWGGGYDPQWQRR